MTKRAPNPPSSTGNAPYPWMTQALLDRVRRDLRRSAAQLEYDRYAMGELYALWFIDAITDEDYHGIVNEERFLRLRALERMKWGDE